MGLRIVESYPDRDRRTKLICTIGPSSAPVVRDLVEAGMDAARLNFAHGTAELRATWADAVRAAADAAGRSIALIADLAGPEVRLGRLGGGVAILEPGRSFTLRPGESATEGGPLGASVDDPELIQRVQVGDRLFLGESTTELRVVAIDRDIETEVAVGGIIRSRAGVHVRGRPAPTHGLSLADRRDIHEALGLGVDYIALSSVRGVADIARLREETGPDGPPIIAKIENRQAVDDFDAILGVADGVLIARGDLGSELPFEHVPGIQKSLVRRAGVRGVPSIVATHMLESMLGSPRPTRAETSDIANTVLDGVDAIQLNYETAIGEYPVEATEVAARICRLYESTETSEASVGSVSSPVEAPSFDSDAKALAYAAISLAAADADVAAIACYTRTGTTARMLASLRPRVPILAFSPDAGVAARLALIHGTVPRICLPLEDSRRRLELLGWLVREADLVPPGAAMVLVASTTDPGAGPNLLEVQRA
jgi:pyruvate kinase